MLLTKCHFLSAALGQWSAHPVGTLVVKIADYGYLLQGARAVGFQDHLLTLGTGSRCVRLWDRRGAQFMESDTAELPLAELEPSCALLAASQDGAAAMVEEILAPALAAKSVMTLVLQGGFLDGCGCVFCELCLSHPAQPLGVCLCVVCGFAHCAHAFLLPCVAVYRKPQPTRFLSRTRQDH